jgi:hypothetical protein
MTKMLLLLLALSVPTFAQTSLQSGQYSVPAGFTFSCSTPSYHEVNGELVLKSAITCSIAHPVATDPGGTALTSCQEISNSGSYYLANDVSCTTQGFALDADNISLNLNGHTITYGGANQMAAIALCDGWYSGFAGCTGDGHHANPEVYGGVITQAPGSAPFSHAIVVGEANGISGGYVHDLTINISSAGSQALHGEYPAGGWKFENNIVNDTVKNIQQPGQSPLSARSQFQGYAFYTDNGPASPTAAGNLWQNITINGSPQGGIVDSEPNSTFKGNHIKLSSAYSNDYCILANVPGQSITGNVCSGRGRGIDSESYGFTITGNTISVHEEANNSEYGGCELDGAYGIRIKNYPMIGGYVPSTNWTVSDNTVTVGTQYCNGTGITFTDLPAGVSGIVSGNVFTVPHGVGASYALAFEGFAADAIQFSQNLFTADTAALIGGDGSINFGSWTIQSGQTWTISAGPTVWAQDVTLGQTMNGSPAISPQLTIQDPVSNASANCYDYSTAVVSVGSYQHTCN